jgi:hypothetical protein
MLAYDKGDMAKPAEEKIGIKAILGAHDSFRNIETTYADDAIPLLLWLAFCVLQDRSLRHFP